MPPPILGLCAVILFGALLTNNILFAQGTAFSYQGTHADNGSAASCYYYLTFAIFDAPSNGNQIGTTLDASRKRQLEQNQLDHRSRRHYGQRHFEVHYHEPAHR
ncbi:MAG TPA: hypothetical protein VNX46_16110 [Candidatus Acidoferrum sp.]|nr:hypothetical protein [Candidatus Acidoferrum sp.]